MNSTEATKVVHLAPRGRKRHIRVAIPERAAADIESFAAKLGVPVVDATEIVLLDGVLALRRWASRRGSS